MNTILSIEQSARLIELGVDAALGKVTYDLIYERTTDDDYEPNR